MKNITSKTELIKEFGEPKVYRKPATAYAVEAKEDCVIASLEGPITAYKGDYVLFDDLTGENMWRNERSIFLKNYEELSQDMAELLDSITVRLEAGVPIKFLTEIIQSA